METLMRFRVSADDRRLFRRAAEKAERKLSDWARRNLIACAQAQLGQELIAPERLERIRNLIAEAWTAGRPDPDKIAAAQDWLRKPKK